MKKIAIIMIIFGFLFERLVYQYILYFKYKQPLFSFVNFQRIGDVYQQPIMWICPAVILIGIILFFIARKENF